ncbi:hypothetical protein [Cryobacterium sp. SO1]|uniref:hypothetical protein n=1 Tax=Cryobacterium sp. SO1 TaxID=1897061 RepID=UPI0010238C03|nr:hypothetical protein [Cryobacterium sp. SO1]
MLTIAGWVIGIAAVLVFLNKTWPWLRRVFRTVDTLTTLADVLPKLITDVAQIRHEVIPNHGGSLRDATDRTETAVAVLSDAVDLHGTQITAIEAGVQHVTRQVAATKTTLAKHSKQLHGLADTTNA